MDAAVGNLQNAMLACHDARAAKDGDAQSRGRGGAERDNLVERDLGREPKCTGSALGKRLHAGRVVHRQARANLGRGANLGGQGKLRDVANSDRSAGNNPRVDAYVVDGTADLVEYGHDTLLKCIGRGESDSLEHVGGHVEARCTLRAGCLDGLERGDGGADLRLIAVMLGYGVRTFVEPRNLERFRTLLIRCQNGLLQRLAGGSAHLVHSGEAHAAALIERHIKARCLKGRGAHAAHMLNQVCRLDGAGLGGLDGEARGGGGERGVVTAGECDSKRLAQARHDGHVNSSAAQHIALERGAGGVNGALASNHAHAAALGHATGHAALDDVTGGGIIGGNGGQELVKLVIVAKLQQVAFAHGLKQLNAGDGGAATAVVGLEAAYIAVGQTAAKHRAHNLAAVVGALVAHHLVARGAILVGVRKVAVKAALELALAGGILILRGRNIGKHVINLMTIHVDDGIHVIGGLHAALELERCGAGVIQTVNKLRRVGVARAQRALATGRGERAAVLVN